MRGGGVEVYGCMYVWGFFLVVFRLVFGRVTLS